MSTYQANKLLVARATGGGLSMLVRTFERPMGLAVDANCITVGTRSQVWVLRNAPDINRSMSNIWRWRSFDKKMD